MREIKFRAWDNKNGGWYHSTQFVIRPYSGKISDGATTPDVILEQFTGLRDKNGKKIYEGDILRQEFCKTVCGQDAYEDYIGHHIGVVVITPNKGVCMKNPICKLDDVEAASISNQYKSVAGYRCEVIGNRWENPELLTQEVSP